MPTNTKTKLIFYVTDDCMMNYGYTSYSQEGEDMILRRIFERKRRGFYVDIGAHHPKRFSNTYYFYRKGWRGINIDATPGSMSKFRKMRSRDINLEVAISDKKQQLLFYIFNDPALNTFDEKLAKLRDGKNGYKIINKIYLQTYTLEEVLDKYLPPGTEIDFLSIDVEGLDFQVLKSNNWSKYRPRVVLVEILKSSLSDLLNSDVVNYMKKIEYEIFAKTFNTVFFIEKKFKDEIYK